MKEIREIKDFLYGKVVTFNDEKCGIIVSSYASGHIMMHLVSCEDGTPYARATLNINNVPVIPYMVVIKSYSENDGLYEALLKAKIIKPCERKMAIGFNFAMMCFLDMPEPPKLKQMGTNQLN
jgi:hypothetical protein